MEFYKPEDIAGILKCNPHTIRILARGGGLPFPCICIGNRVKIPKAGFDNWMRGGVNNDAVRGGCDSVRDHGGGLSDC